MKRVLFLIATVLFVLGGSSARSQFVQSPNDHGTADSMEMVMAVIPDVATNKKKVEMQLWVFNDSDDVVSSSVGFRWVNPVLSMDSAKESPLALSSFNLQRFLYFKSNVDTTNVYDQFLFAGVRISGNGVVKAPTRRLWATYYFKVATWTVSDSILLDTLTFNTGTIFKFINSANQTYAPYWLGKKVVYDTAYEPPANIGVAPDTVFFNAVQGSPAPPSQVVSITSDGNPLAISLIESVSWILKSPSSGTTPLNVNVSTNISGLPPGVYFDSIRVQASGALNSPQQIYVKLSLIEPPPTISALPSSFIFSGVLGQGIPPSKTLIVKNTGGQTLNWTATNSQTWLQLSPSFGVDSAGVSVSVDTTGLLQGDYVDTIIVSDPAASNNPVKVPVSFSIGTSFTTIVTNPNPLFFVQNPSSPIVFTKTFEVLNGGIGNLRFKITENSARIQSIIPDTGIAPLTITVTYKYSGAFEGLDVYDTITIRSDDAVNTPLEAETHIRYTAFPAVIATNLDTVKLTVFACSQGEVPLDSDTLFVTNTGGDNPLELNVQASSSYFYLNHVDGIAPDQFLVSATSAIDSGFPPGVYYDSLTIFGVNAVNNPKTVIVEYTVSTGTEPPVISLSTNSLTVPYQEESGPAILDVFDIDNAVGGCMPWHLNNEIDWLAPSISSGNVPGQLDAVADAPGYVFGQYYDTLYVVAPGAANDSVAYPVALLVWRFHGDVDYNGIIDIADLTDMIEFLFLSELNSAPQPTLLVGDLDCDNMVDISDVTYLIAYLFIGGPIPCGNPF